MRGVARPVPARTRAKSQMVAELGERLVALAPDDLGACIERAEALVGTIDPEALYAEDALLAQLAGRPGEVDNPGMVVGRALLADLSALVEALSEAAGQTRADLGPGAMSADALAERWSVSRKTVARYRRAGLVSRRVLAGSRTEVVFSAGAVERFERLHGARLDRAARFTRRTDEEFSRLEREARRYRARFGWSLNRVARRVAERRGRSVEGVRQALRRIDAGAAEPIFGASGPPGARERAMFARAQRRGIEPSEIAERAGRSVASVRRGATEHRATELRGLDLAGPGLKTFEREDAREVLLAPDAARTGLGAGGVDDLGDFLADARARRVPDRATEDARAVALHFLRHDARRRIDTLSTTTAEPSEVDRAETDLRWASLLKAELVRPHLTLIVETLEPAVGSRLEDLPARELRDILGRALGAASHAIDRHDPSRGGRVAAAIGLSVSRVAAEWSHAHPGGASEPTGRPRAARALSPGEPFRDWTLALDPWQRHLAVDSRVRGVLGALDERSRTVLALRHGIDAGEGSPGPPRTLAETAETLGTSVVHAARFERQAVREAIEFARGGQGDA